MPLPPWCLKLRTAPPALSMLASPMAAKITPLQAQLPSLLAARLRAAQPVPGTRTSTMGAEVTLPQWLRLLSTCWASCSAHLPWHTCCRRCSCLDHQVAIHAAA